MEQLRDGELEMLYVLHDLLPNRYNTLTEILATASRQVRDLALNYLHGLVDQGYLERKFLAVRIADDQNVLDEKTEASFRIISAKNKRFQS